LLLRRALLSRMVGPGTVMVRTMVALAMRTLMPLPSLMIHDQP
jgi:hypothetical protein